MAKRKATSAAVLANAPVCGPGTGGDESRTVEVRRIDNGYVTRRSSYASGEYKSSETYSADKPSLMDGAAGHDRSATSVLREAVKSLK